MTKTVLSEGSFNFTHTQHCPYCNVRLKPIAKWGVNKLQSDGSKRSHMGIPHFVVESKQHLEVSQGQLVGRCPGPGKKHNTRISSL